MSDNYRETTRELINRMRKVEGQARGIRKMIEEDRSCEEIIMQLSAMRAAINKVGMKLIGSYMGKCLREEIENDGDESKAIEKAINTFLKFS